MTSFNNAAVLMPLDEYYDHYVDPKPSIPKHYPGFSGRKKRRLAAHLQTYKENDADNDEEEEDEMEDESQQPIDEINSSIESSNQQQLDFETNDFNILYDESNNLTEKRENTTNSAESETLMKSAQWQMTSTNLNRPPGAAPLVPNPAPRVNLRPTSTRTTRGGKQKKKYWQRFNHHYNRKNRWQNQIELNQSGQNAFAQNFQNTNQVNLNHNQQQQVLMNTNNIFPFGKSEINISTQLIPTQGDGNSDRSNNWTRPNSLASLISSANQIANNNPVQGRLESYPPIHSNNFTLGNQQPQNFNLQLQPVSNAQTKVVPESIRLALGNQQPQNFNLQLQPVSNAQTKVVPETIRLADLMSLDRSNCGNLNIAEVAKNALLLLSSVFHKPILNEDVQQEISQMQQNSVLPEEPLGLHMNIKPESTDVSMYERFK